MSVNFCGVHLLIVGLIVEIVEVNSFIFRRMGNRSSSTQIAFEINVCSNFTRSGSVFVELSTDCPPFWVVISLILPVHPDATRLRVTLATFPVSSLEVVAPETALAVPIFREIRLSDPYPLGDVFLYLWITKLGLLPIIWDGMWLL